VSQPDSAPSQDPVPSSDRVIAIGRATIRGVDFSKARFDRFALADCLFLRCDFHGVRFDRRWQLIFSSQPRNVFRDCRFNEADMRRVRPDLARFEHCTFDDANLDGWRSESAEFVGCRFAGSVGRVTFFGRPGRESRKRVGRKRNEFAGNDFRDVDLDGITFARGIDLGAQRLPEGDDVIRLDRFAQRIAFARVEVVEWDARDGRKAGLVMLNALAARYRGQTDVIAPRVSATGAPPRVQVRVWALLERVIA
jgi:uncharacterized protein YjbI with pentapeptide repeats